MWIVRTLAERPGFKPQRNETQVDRGLDWVCKHLTNLTGKQAYDLKMKRKIVYEDRGWTITVTIEERQPIGEMNASNTDGTSPVTSSGDDGLHERPAGRAPGINGDISGPGCDPDTP